MPSESFRVPPQDLEAEQSVLGAMMLKPEAIDVVTEILDGRDFYREAHRHIFDAIISLNEKKEPIDVVTLTNELRQMGKMELVGSTSDLMLLVDRVPTASNAEHYAQIVKEMSSGRKLAIAGTTIASEAYDTSIPLKEKMDMAEFRIFEATEQKVQKGFVQIKNIIGKVFEEVYETIGSDNHLTGLPMGIPRLDVLTRGLQPSKLYIVGARPGVGKTALAMNIAWNVASGKSDPAGIKSPVGIFSIEMTEEEIGQRLLCSVAQVDYNAAKEGRTLIKDQQALTKASARIYEAPIFIDDSSALTIMELKSRARRLKKAQNIQLLVVDYLQLLRAGVQKDNREQEIAWISMNLKALAKDLDIPILVASQLSRPMKGTEGKPPGLSDLRESGSIEQDANVVIFIHKWKTKEDGWKHQLMLSKNRSGQTDEEIPINFSAFSTTFHDIDVMEQRGLSFENS